MEKENKKTTTSAQILELSSAFSMALNQALFTTIINYLKAKDPNYLKQFILDYKQNLEVYLTKYYKPLFEQISGLEFDINQMIKEISPEDL